MEQLLSFFSVPYVLGISGILMAFFMSIMMYPAIIILMRRKHIMDKPVSRSSHAAEVPTLGGVGIFIAFSLSLMIIASLSDLIKPEFDNLIMILAAITILFFLGVKDDLIGLSPTKKLIGQAVAVTLVVLFTDIRIFSLEGLFGIGELSYNISVVLSILIFIFIINAFNFIDGIDGLAGTIAVIVSAFLGIFFFLNGNYLLLLVSLTLIGATVGFLRFNLSVENKLFMGDSGSLFIGFLLAYQAICFLNFQQAGTLNFEVTNAPILIIAVLAFPVLDTMRVFIIRIVNKRSPFSADTNHIHHRLLGLGLTHKQATFTLAIANVLIISTAFLIVDFNIHLQMLIIVATAQLVCFSPFFIIRKKGKIKLNLPYLHLVR